MSFTFALQMYLWLHRAFSLTLASSAALLFGCPLARRALCRAGFCRLNSASGSVTLSRVSRWDSEVCTGSKIPSPCAANLLGLSRSVLSLHTFWKNQVWFCKDAENGMGTDSATVNLQRSTNFSL